MDNWLMLCGLSLMRQGSATVEADVIVTEGQRIAEVGNSGSTAEPHLHIHTGWQSSTRHPGRCRPAHSVMNTDFNEV